MPGRIFLLFLFLPLFLLVAMVHADWSDRFALAKEVSLTELIEKPDSWIGIPVRIPLRFAWISDIYVPYRTRFNPDNFLNFTAWDIQSHIWEQQGFDKNYPYFYVEKDNPEFKTFLKLEAFQTVCILGQIESIFADKPFIRVAWVEKLPGSLNRLNLKMLNKATRLYKQRKFEEALVEFQKILHTYPPADIRTMIYKAMAKYYIYEKKAFALAQLELRKAKVLSPKDSEIVELAQICQMYAPKPVKVPAHVGVVPAMPLNPSVPSSDVITEPDPVGTPLLAPPPSWETIPEVKVSPEPAPQNKEAVEEGKNSSNTKTTPQETKRSAPATPEISEPPAPTKTPSNAPVEEIQEPTSPEPK